MGMKGLLSASYAAGFAMASSEDPAYYGCPPGCGARPGTDVVMPMLPAAFVAANADRRPYQEKTTARDVTDSVKSMTWSEWQRLKQGIGWGGGVAA